MKRVLAADYLIADVVVHLKTPQEIAKLQDFAQARQYEQLSALVAESGAPPGSKAELDDAGFHRFSTAIAGLPKEVFPGGSSANIVTTLSRLLGDDVAVDFIGLAGAGPYDHAIVDDLQDARVELHPDHLPAGAPSPASALSFVFVYPEGWPDAGVRKGQRVLFTYPGNARALIAPEMATDALLHRADMLLVQGALWEKFGPVNADPDDVAFAARLMECRWRHDKDLLLTLPTHAKFGGRPRTRAHFLFLLEHADMVSCNEEELRRIFDTGSDLGSALRQLQDKLNRRDGNDLGAPGSTGRTHREKAAVALVTCGEDGAYLVSADARRRRGLALEVVTKGSIQKFAPPVIRPDEVVNTLGAGDTAFAGFVAGYLRGLDYAICAELATALTGCKLRSNAARLKNPLAELREAAPQLAELLDGQR
jgi:sugar/nucleoside kinase (ribokinase family)